MNERSKLILEVLPGVFSVCKVADHTQVNFEAPFVFTGRTDLEKSLVCPTDAVPSNTLAREDGWKGFRIKGTLDFSLVGILADITGILAEKKIPVFAISTYETDYIFTKESFLDTAVQNLKSSGYCFADKSSDLES